MRCLRTYMLLTTYTACTRYTALRLLWHSDDLLDGRADFARRFLTPVFDPLRVTPAGSAHVRGPRSPAEPQRAPELRGMMYRCVCAVVAREFPETHVVAGRVSRATRANEMTNPSSLLLTTSRPNPPHPPPASPRAWRFAAVCR